MSSYHIVLLLDDAPHRAFLETILEVLSERNREWYLAQWRQRLDPPISALDGGVRWQPDRPDVRAVFEDAPTVFAQRVASCGPIAAIAVGYARARDQVDGWSLEAVRAQHRVVLRRQSRASWHAYCQHGSNMVDPTRGMVR